MKKMLANYKVMMITSIPSMCIFFGVVTAIMLISILVSELTLGIGMISMSLDIASLIFMAISVATIKPFMRFGMQNGLSRKNFFISLLLFSLSLAIVVGIFISLLDTITFVVTGGEATGSLLKNIQMAMGGVDIRVIEFYKELASSIQYMIGFAILGGSIGTLVGGINTRFEKNAKVLIYALLGLALVVTFVIDMALLEGIIMRSSIDFMNFLIAKMYRLVIVALVVQILAGVISWLLLRKVELK